jgi:pyruvate formate lyase activating enzyme
MREGKRAYLMEGRGKAMVSREKSLDSHDALWWRKEQDGRVLCVLCPRFCRIGEGQAGFCYIRRNEGGRLVTYGYGRPTGFGLDPIEKKPLNHFLPGSSILSFGTAGCNLGCKFCQNWTTSKARSDDRSTSPVTPEQVVRLAREEKCASIAYTYNEPTIFGEFVVDVSRIAREEGIRNVMVTNGYVTTEARGDLFRNIDGANVDLKAFTDDFYRRQTLSHIDPVLDTLRWLAMETEVWVEITTLLIPGLNDSPDEIRKECDWIVENLGEEIPLHFTAFHPDFRMTGRPRTPPSTLRSARSIAHEAGLHFVYVGNVLDREAQATSCPGCGTLLIERDWHSVRLNRITGSSCPDCGRKIPGVF